MPSFEVSINGELYDVEAAGSEYLPQIVDRILAEIGANPSVKSGSGKFEAPSGAQASPEAQAFYQENPPLNLRSSRFEASPEAQPARVSDISASPELASEILRLKVPQGTEITQSNVDAILNSMRGMSVREILNREIASKGVSPSAQIDPEQFPVLSRAWEEYKAEMDPSFLGAALRGAQSQIGPVAGSLVGGAIGGMAGGVPGLAGVIGGGVVGGEIQSAIEEKIRTPEEQVAAKAQAEFDKAKSLTRWGKAVGEFAPQLVTGKPGIGSVKQAVTQGLISTAIPLFLGGTKEEAITSGIGSAVTQPRDFISRILQKPIRTERAAQIGARNVVAEYAKKGGETTEQVLEKLQRVPSELTSENVKPFATELTGNEGLISLSNALSNLNPILRKARIESRAGVSGNIGKALRESGATFEQTEEFFRNYNKQLLQDAENAFLNYVEAGDRKAAKILEDKILNTEERLKTASEKVASQENIFEAVTQALESARLEIAGLAGQKDASSLAVKKVWMDELNKELKAINEAYNPQKISTLTSEASSARAASEELEKAYKGVAEVPSFIKSSLKNLKKNKIFTVQEIRANISQINDEITAATNQKRFNEARLLGILKSGYEDDISKLGNISTDIANANSLYKSFKDKYGGKHGDSVRYEKTEDSRTIDEFLNAPREVNQQLRDAIKEDRNALKAIENWILNDLAVSLGDKATPEKFNKWLTRRSVEGWLHVFPEVRPLIEEYSSDIGKKIKLEQSAKEALKLSKLEAEGIKSPYSPEAEAIKNRASREADIAFKERQKQIAESAATKVIGSSPINAIEQIMESKGNPLRESQELVSIASRDKTGKALEGLKNAMRLYMREEFSRFGEVVTTLEDPSKALSLSDMASSFAKMNKLLNKDSESRKVIEQILGKNSRELNMMDLARGQIEVMERFRRGAGGQSVTSLNTAISKEFDDTLKKTGFGILARLAYKLVPENYKPSMTRSAAERLLSAISIDGNTASRAAAILTEAVTDPEKLKVLLMPLNEETLPKAKSLFKLYFIPRLEESPNSQESEK